MSCARRMTSTSTWRDSTCVWRRNGEVTDLMESDLAKAIRRRANTA